MDHKACLASGLLVAFLTILSAGPGLCQAIDWVADVWNVSLERGPDSARLEGMGGLLLGIPDEGRELNVNDYGNILAGKLWDSDASRVELWYRSSDGVVDLFDAQRIRTRTRTQLAETGTTLSWRVNPRRIFGVEGTLERLGSQIERSDRNVLRNPTMGGFGIQQFGSFAVGGQIGFNSDDQSLKTSNVFAIRHDGSGRRYVGSAAYRRGTFNAGAQIERQVNTITGWSHDESRFHEDKMTWERPVGIYSGVVCWEPNEKVTGSIRGAMERIDGREDARISWSDRMPDNPGRAALLLNVGTFGEKVRRNTVGSRWVVHPIDPFLLGAELEAGRIKQDVTEGENFKGSRRAEHAKRSWTRLGVGGGYELASGKLQVGADGWYLRTIDEENLDSSTSSSKVTARTVELRSGAEWFVTGALALRAGYMRTAADSDTDQPGTLLKGPGYSLGLGYLPRGGLVQLDASFRYRSMDPSYDGDPSQEESGTAFSLGARFLF